MHSPFSFGPLALAVASFLSIAFGLGLPVDGVVRRNINDEEMGLLQKKDLLCLQDRWLESFETYIDEAYPSCSSFLGIESITTTVPATARTCGIPALYGWDVC